MFLKPLGRDYWPPELRWPYLRLALSLAAAPLAVAVALWLFAVTVYSLDPNDIGSVRPANEAALSFLRVFVPLTALAAAPATLLLWSLRLRSRRAFLLAGLLVGGAGAAFHALATGMTRLGATLLFLGFGAILMQSVRLLGGIRR